MNKYCKMRVIKPKIMNLADVGIELKNEKPRENICKNE